MRVAGTVYNVEWQRGCIRLTDERLEALINSLRVASLTGDEALTAFRGVVSNENRRTAVKFFGALTQETTPLEGDVELEVTRQEVEDIELALFTYAQHESRLLSSRRSTSRMNAEHGSACCSVTSRTASRREA